jgi:Domain of unknown function (DUF4276)
MTNMVGIIAEDESDVDVISILMRKMARKPFGLKRQIGRGSGRIRGKCRAWANTLKHRGCNLLIIVHDLDARELRQLYRDLCEALGASPIADHAIIIPVRELEAWLLADHTAIQRAFRFRAPLGQIANPQGIQRPKEFLRDLIYQRSERRIIYLNTVHNVKIAEQCTPANLRRCESFQPLADFVARTLV